MTLPAHWLPRVFSMVSPLQYVVLQCLILFLFCCCCWCYCVCVCVCVRAWRGAALITIMPFLGRTGLCLLCGQHLHFVFLFSHRHRAAVWSSNLVSESSPATACPSTHSMVRLCCVQPLSYLFPFVRCFARTHRPGMPWILSRPTPFLQRSAALRTAPLPVQVVLLLSAGSKHSGNSRCVFPQQVESEDLEHQVLL